jgi:hypothetical protein
MSQIDVVLGIYETRIANIAKGVGERSQLLLHVKDLHKVQTNKDNYNIL